MRFIFFCIWLISYSSTIYWKDHPFSIELPLLLCQKTIGNKCVGVFLNTLSHFLDLFVYPDPTWHCTDYRSFTISLEIRKHKSFNTAILFQSCFSYTQLFAFSYSAGPLFGMTLSLYINLTTMRTLFDPRTQYSSPLIMSL